MLASPRDRCRGGIMLMIGLAVTAVSAQERRSVVQVPNAQPPVFSSRAERVVAHITVKDRQGAYVTALPREAFRILEDGVPQRIDVFSGEDSPSQSERQQLREGGANRRRTVWPHTGCSSHS